MVVYATQTTRQWLRRVGIQQGRAIQKRPDWRQRRQVSA